MQGQATDEAPAKSSTQDAFTQVSLLEIDEPTILARLDTRQDNEWAVPGDSREYIRRLLPGYQDRLRVFGTILIDARAPRPCGRRDNVPQACERGYEPSQEARQSLRQ